MKFNRINSMNLMNIFGHIDDKFDIFWSIQFDQIDSHFDQFDAQFDQIDQIDAQFHQIDIACIVFDVS